MIKILDRYIIKELLDPFIFGVAAFTLILSASMVMFELVRAVILMGMPFYIAVQLFLFRLPSVMVYIFPMAMLLAAILSFARLSADKEVTAFRAGGVSLYRLMVPVLIMGLVISFLTLSFYEIIVPEANRASAFLMVQTRIDKAPKIQDNVFMPELEQGTLKRIFYARKIKGNVMEGVIIQEFNNGQLSQLVNAKTAQWQNDKWVFRNGITYLLSDTGEYKHLLKFDEQYITIKFTPADLYMGDKKPDEMNFNSLRDYIDLKKKMGANVTDLLIQLNMKLSIPFACFVFALLGAPLGLNPTRKSSSIGLGISVIIIFVYYVLMFIGMAAGEMEMISPFLSAWLPNVITAGIGGWILYKAGQ
ncbi:MAG: LptF/LptG family permease [Candidatus Saganbacteria bacterium]|nr:LptF/LptG family permease [Candidatus Saganbacteria bacterium]